MSSIRTWLILHALLLSARQLVSGCGDELFSPLQKVVRDAYMLTEGESLILSCRVCGVCLEPDDPGCSNRNQQIWMTASDREKFDIKQRTKRPVRDKSKAPVKGPFRTIRRMIKQMKALMAAVKDMKRKVKKGFLTMKSHVAASVQRFDRLKRLGMESDGGTSFIKAILKSRTEEVELQWFMESASGDVSQVKHDQLGIRLLFDLLVISRANAGNTGTYICQYKGRVRAQFGVTVADAGVEPYREFVPNSGRSLQPKLLSKANLEVYTRWMDKTLSFMLPTREESSTPPESGKVDAVKISITWGICYVKQLDVDRPVMPEGSPSLKLMPNGLPCRSHLLPISVRSLRSVIKRPSEARKVRGVVRVDEKALDFGLSATNFTSASPPPLSVEATVIKRSFMISKQGEFVSLECPLKQTVRTLIVWFVLPNNTQRGDSIRTEHILDGALNPYDLRDVTGGRVFTDPGGNLNIANVTRLTDHRKYFCLHRGRLVGYVNLIVRNAKEESQMTYSMLLVVGMLRVASPLIITASIIFLTLVSASSMFEPEVPW